MICKAQKQSVIFFRFGAVVKCQSTLFEKKNIWDIYKKCLKRMGGPTRQMHFGVGSQVDELFCFRTYIDFFYFYVSSPWS